jgi:hypothetical protein
MLNARPVNSGVRRQWYATGSQKTLLRVLKVVITFDVLGGDMGWKCYRCWTWNEEDSEPCGNSKCNFSKADSVKAKKKKKRKPVIKAAVIILLLCLLTVWCTYIFDAKIWESLFVDTVFALVGWAFIKLKRRIMNRA